MKRTKIVRKPSRALTAALAANLRAFREASGLSQEAFAELCGLHRMYSGSVERCERNVNFSTMEVFAAALGVTVSALLAPKVLKK